MSKGDLLRAIYDDKNATWYVNSDHKIGSRRFTTDSSGNVMVEYLDRDGKRIASAREVRSYGKYPQVEFLNKDGDVKGHAYLELNLIGNPNVSYYNYVGDKVGEKFFDEKRLDGILEDYRLDNGVTKKETMQKVETQCNTDGGNGGAAVDSIDMSGIGMGSIGIGGMAEALPGILFFSIFTGFITHIIYSAIYEHLDMLRYYGGIICVFASVPVMLLLHLVICRIPENAPAHVRGFRLGHTILATLAFAALAVVQSIIYLDISTEIFERLLDGSSFGFYHFLASFAPLMAYGLISGIWTLSVKHKTGGAMCVNFSCKSMQLVMYGTVTLIAVTQLVELVIGYNPGNFGMILIYSLAAPFLALLIFLANTVACLPYRLLSRCFRKATP